jgi:hypothetical protein
MFGRSRRPSSPEDAPAPAAGSGERWLALVATLPVDDAAGRMKVLRTFETLGAGVLRDGVYLLPDGEPHRASFARLVDYVRSIRGDAHLLTVTAADAAQSATFRKLFDRSERYESLAKNVEALRAGFGVSDAAAIGRVLARQRDEFDALVALDFFGSPARERAARALTEIDREVAAMMFPQDTRSSAKVQSRKAYFRKLWATRKPLWADRLAAAWLIRRFIDAEAQLIWLDKAASPPEAAVTFGFEGAEFANTKHRLTYEELLHAFQLHRNSGLARIATLVKAVETGDVSVAQASGIETMLKGAQHRAANEHELLAEAEKTFDLLYESNPELAGVRR